MCFTCSIISVLMTTRNDSELSRKAGVHRLRIAVAPRGERGEDGAEGERSQDARDVELNRVERDRVRQILLVDERRNQRLIRRDRRTPARSR